MKIIFLLLLLLKLLNAEDDLLDFSLEKDPTVKSTISSASSDIVNTEKYIKVSLIDVVLETVSQSNNAKAAREKVTQAKIKVDDAKADYLPTVSGTYKLSRTDTRPGDDDSSKKYFNDESYKVTVSQNIYKGGSTSSEIRRLEKKYAVSKNDYRLVIAKEIQNAVKAYFDVLFNFQTFNVNIENMDRLNEILEIVNIKYESGATSLGNLSNIKANVSNAESKLIRVQSKFNESLEFYEYIVGDKFIKTFPFEENFDTNVSKFDILVKKAIENNMLIENYSLKIAAEKINLQKSTSSFRPSIDLELSAENVLDQEDYVSDEKNYKAGLLFSYNFYNKGKDKNKLLTINSKIRELNFRKKEEIRKLKWSLSKLHRSIISITNETKSKQTEVSASKDMVTAYWDGFKLGEQDLQELLQGQRQLNTAQIELIKNKKTAITDYFKLLDKTDELLNFFNLDVDSDNYIDFTRSDYRSLLQTELAEHSKKSELKKDILDSVILDVNETKQVDLNTSIEDLNTTIGIDTNETEKPINVVVTDTLDDLLNFKKEFLVTPDEKWTIWLYYFDKVYQSLDFARDNNISKNIFVFDSLIKNEVKSNIAYSVFDTKDLATKALVDLNTTQVNSKVLNVGEIKSKYNLFKKKKLQNKVKKVKVFHTDRKFKQKFLNSPKEYYTINITSLSSMQKAESLVKKANIVNNSFIFSYGDEQEWIKVLYGVFKTYEEAKEALNNLVNIKEKYEPIIEVIETKQALYHTYNAMETEKEKAAVISPPSVEVKKVFSNFEETFLNAPAEYYTINLATLLDAESSERFKKRYSENLELFVFKFGADKTYFKAMSGVFASIEEAQQAIDSLPTRLRENKPRIERVSIKQNLYYKYNTKINETTNLEVK